METNYWLWMKDRQDLYVSQDNQNWSKIPGETTDNINWVYTGKDLVYKTGTMVHFCMRETGAPPNGYGGYKFTNSVTNPIWDPARTDPIMLNTPVTYSETCIDIQMPAVNAEGFMIFRFLNADGTHSTYDPQVRADTGHPTPGNLELKVAGCLLNVAAEACVLGFQTGTRFFRRGWRPAAGCCGRRTHSPGRTESDP